MPKPHTFKPSVKDIAVAGICLAAAVAVCLLLRFTVGAAGFGAVFLLSTAIVSEKTRGYYGIFEAAAGAVLTVVFKGGVSAEAAVEFAAVLLAGIVTALIIGRSKGASERAVNEKLRADLLRSAAHDIRSPLASIKLSAALLADREERFSQKERTDLLCGICDSADRLTLMMENILTLTSGRLSSQSLKMQRVSAEEIISDAALNFRRLHSDIAVITNIPHDPLDIMMDAQLIGQVMQNLLENAAKHGKADLIEVTLEVGNGFAVFRFSDNGKGIPENVLGNLFEECSESGAVADGARSMGVGLSLCKTVIALHGGAISGRNTGNGAEFAFTLPL